MNKDLNTFMLEQQQLIEKQQQQINSLLQVQQQTKIIQEQKEYINRLNHIETPQYDNVEKKIKIDPYKILDISKNYDERSLKKAYLKMANKTHPDKGGDERKFKIVTIAYKVLMKKLSARDSDKIHNELKKNSEKFIKSQDTDIRENSKLKDKNFNMEVFNREFDQNRTSDEFADTGYGDWLTKNEPTNKPTKKLNKQNFNDEFQKHKSNQKGSQLQKYSEPRELVSMSNADSILVLGNEKVTSYTGESNGLHYRDLKEAYEEPTLIDVNSVNISNRENNIDGYSRQRKNIKFQMSENDMKRQALKIKREEIDEKNRIKRLSERDEQSRISYERIHQRLMGS